LNFRFSHFKNKFLSIKLPDKKKLPNQYMDYDHSQIED